MELGGCMGGISTPRLHPLITTVQTLVPNDVTNTRWHCPYPGYFGFIFVRWEEMEMRCLSLHTVCGLNRLNSDVTVVKQSKIYKTPQHQDVNWLTAAITYINNKRWTVRCRYILTKCQNILKMKNVKKYSKFTVKITDVWDRKRRLKRAEQKEQKLRLEPPQLSTEMYSLMATGRKDFLWRSVVHCGGNSLLLKVLLCVTSTSCRGWESLSTMLHPPLWHHHQRIKLHPQDRASLPDELSLLASTVLSLLSQHTTAKKIVLATTAW